MRHDRTVTCRFVMLATLVALAGAARSRAAELVGTSTTTFALDSASRVHAHWVSQRYWVAFHNGTTAVLFSSPDGVSWTSQGAIFSSFNPPANTGDWAVRFDGARIIAVGFRAADTNRYYRNGILNADGTVTWNAADAIASGCSGTCVVAACTSTPMPSCNRTHPSAHARKYPRKTTIGTSAAARAE